MSVVTPAQVSQVVEAVRRSGPRIHCLGPSVSQPLVADGLLAAGAQPLMTDSRAEAPSLVVLADALVVNVGALTPDRADAIPPAVAAARSAGVPWVLDPAAIGRAPVRTPLARALLADHPTAVRGNASEVLALADAGSGSGGADTADPVSSAVGAADVVAERCGAVLVSGPRDLVVTSTWRQDVVGGDALLERVTGTGCLLSALVAACATVAPPGEATVAAATWMARAAEQAAHGAQGPGSFRVALLDALAEVTP